MSFRIQSDFTDEQASEIARSYLASLPTRTVEFEGQWDFPMAHIGLGADTGTIILTEDHPGIRRGAPVHITSTYLTAAIDGVVTRRLRLRSGELKLWWERQA